MGGSGADQVLLRQVYVNAAGFLRIRPRKEDEYEDKGKKSRRQEGERMGLLDNTRVHPECYDDNDW